MYTRHPWKAGNLMYILFVIYSLFNIICTSVYILFITMLLYRLDHRLYIYIYICIRIA